MSPKRGRVACPFLLCGRRGPRSQSSENDATLGTTAEDAYDLAVVRDEYCRARKAVREKMIAIGRSHRRLVRVGSLSRLDELQSSGVATEVRIEDPIGSIDVPKLRVAGRRQIHESSFSRRRCSAAAAFQGHLARSESSNLRA